jgi:hypothetical protein
MLRLICVALLLCVAAPAFAKGKHHHRGAHSVSVVKKHGYAERHFKKRLHRTKYVQVSKSARHAAAKSARHAGVKVAQQVRRGDPRPSAWCGWWARQQFGVADRSYNLARKWAQIGTPAHGPAPGVIAVWRHHVGIVISVPGPGRIVLKSGNDGHAVRERERSSRGVIAYRWSPGRVVASAI